MTPAILTAFAAIWSDHSTEELRRQVDTNVAYRGNPANNGQANDPMIGGRIGGVNVFGGGLALYNADGGRAEMSGNGVSCLAQAVVDAGVAAGPTVGSDQSFMTVAAG